MHVLNKLERVRTDADPDDLAVQLRQTMTTTGREQVTLLVVDAEPVVQEGWLSQNGHNDMGFCRVEGDMLRDRMLLVHSYKDPGVDGEPRRFTISSGSIFSFRHARDGEASEARAKFSAAVQRARAAQEKVECERAERRAALEHAYALLALDRQGATVRAMLLSYNTSERVAAAVKALTESMDGLLNGVAEGVSLDNEFDLSFQHDEFTAAFCEVSGPSHRHDNDCLTDWLRGPAEWGSHFGCPALSASVADWDWIRPRLLKALTEGLGIGHVTEVAAPGLFQGKGLEWSFASVGSDGDILF